MAPASVFLSHAGEQKREFVGFLYQTLYEENISVFLDEDSLTLGDQAWEKIVYNLKAAPVGAQPASYRLEQSTLTDEQRRYVSLRWVACPSHCIRAGVA